MVRIILSTYHSAKDSLSSSPSTWFSVKLLVSNKFLHPTVILFTNHSFVSPSVCFYITISLWNFRFNILTIHNRVFPNFKSFLIKMSPGDFFGMGLWNIFSFDISKSYEYLPLNRNWPIMIVWSRQWQYKIYLCREMQRKLLVWEFAEYK